jgi:hypothetical protein
VYLKNQNAVSKWIVTFDVRLLFYDSDFGKFGSIEYILAFDCIAMDNIIDDQKENSV